MDKKRINSWCKIGFVAAFIESIIGIVLCIYGIYKARDYREDGEGLAKAGIAIAIIKFIVVIVLFIFLRNDASLYHKVFDKKEEVVTIVKKIEPKKEETYKYVSTKKINLNLSGDIKEDKAIKSVTLDGVDYKEYTIKVYSNDKEKIEELKRLDINLDITGLGDETYSNEYKLELDEIYYVVDNTVDINIEFGDRVTKAYSSNTIKERNKMEGKQVNLYSSGDVNVSFNVSGVSEYVDNFNIEEATLFINLENKGNGTYNIPVEIECNNKFLYCDVDKIVLINIK